MHHSQIGLAALIGLLALPASAGNTEDEAIATDRPDFVESAQVVGKGRVQLETSWEGSRAREDGRRVRERATPSLLRIGVAEDWELRVETDGRMRLNVQGSAPVAGWADSAIGLKWHVADGEGSRPDVALLLHLDLDSGSGPWRGDGRRPSLRVTAEWEGEGGLGLGCMAGLVREREGGASYLSGLYGVVLGKTLSPQWRGFVELAQEQIALSRRGLTQASLDLGLAYQPHKDVQLDTALKYGLNRNTPDLRWTVGLSLRY